MSLQGGDFLNCDVDDHPSLNVVDTFESVLFSRPPEATGVFSWLRGLHSLKALTQAKKETLAVC